MLSTSAKMDMFEWTQSVGMNLVDSDRRQLFVRKHSCKKLAPAPYHLGLMAVILLTYLIEKEKSIIKEGSGVNKVQLWQVNGFAVQTKNSKIRCHVQ